MWGCLCKRLLCVEHLKGGFLQAGPQLAVGELISHSMWAPSQVTCRLRGICKPGTMALLSSHNRCPLGIRTGSKVCGLAGRAHQTESTARAQAFENYKVFWMSQNDKDKDGYCGW